MNPTETLSFGGQAWALVKRRLDRRYAQLTQEDLHYVPGEEDALLARIAARTMEKRSNLERFLREECGCQWQAGGGSNQP